MFSTLPKDELASLSSKLEPMEVKAGKFIIREGTDGTDMFFVNRGKLKVCRADKDGKEVILAVCGPGDVVGEIALLTSAARTADVVSVTPCRLLRCTRESFRDHTSKFSGLASALLQFMAHRVRKATERITDLALYDVTCRVARVLYEMSVISTLEDHEVHLISDKPTHQALASMVGASREAVTRALAVLESEGHLEMDEERIWLHSLPSH